MPRSPTNYNPPSRPARLWLGSGPSLSAAHRTGLVGQGAATAGGSGSFQVDQRLSSSAALSSEEALCLRALPHQGPPAQPNGALGAGQQRPAGPHCRPWPP